jgi:hyperosmotically inducible protein
MRRVPILLLAFAVATAGSGRLAAQSADQALFVRVAEAIRTYARYGVFDSVDIGVDDRVVTLSGRVTQPLKKDDIEDRVRRIEGVRSVRNEIGVLPVSPADDALRYRVARAIYNHPMFWVHAQASVPPIHIVVERGRITLTGVAGTDAERAVAASLAQVSGNFGVTNRIRVTPR